MQATSIRQAARAIATTMLLLAMVASAGACSQYAQSARVDAADQAPAISAHVVDAAASARFHYQQEREAWTNLLAHGADKALFEKHLTAFGDSAMRVQKDLSQMQKTLRLLGSPTQELDALKTAHQDMLMSQFEAFHAHYDKTGADARSQHKVKAVIDSEYREFGIMFEQFLVQIANGEVAPRS